MSPGIRVEPAGHTGQAFSFSRSQLWGLNLGSAGDSRKTHRKHLEGLLIMSDNSGVQRQEIKYFGSSFRRKVLRNLGFWGIQAQGCMQRYC